MERLQKILSQAGVASRRASEQMMLDGRVTVNGFDMTGATRDDENREVKGRIGSGGSRLTIRTGDGGITVARN